MRAKNISMLSRNHDSEVSKLQMFEKAIDHVLISGQGAPMIEHLSVGSDDKLEEMQVNVEIYQDDHPQQQRDRDQVEPQNVQSIEANEIKQENGRLM